MNLKSHYRLMSRYNRWMNENLYAACATLSDEARKEDRGAFFKSIHGILNHLLLADTVWMARFKGEPSPGYPSLAHQIHSDFEALRRDRETLDREIEAWADSLDEEKFASALAFRTMTGDREIRQPFWIAVSHFFNHQTHHRGQLTTLLDQFGVDYEATDLLKMPGASEFAG